MSAFTITDITNLVAYATSESSTSTADQVIISNFKQTTSNLSSSQKSDIVSLLEQIKSIAQENQSNLDTMKQNMNTAKSLLTQEINDLNSSNALSQLYSYQANIDPQILSISSEQFNTYYSRIQELEYRQNALDYKIQNAKSQSDQINTDIETINKYIAALQTP